MRHPVVTNLLKTPSELFEVKRQLAMINVFGPWRKKESGHDGFERPEPDRNEPRVYVWHCDGSYDLEAGWYFRIGFGVVDIAGFSNRDPIPSSQECRDGVDEILRKADGVVIVENTDTRPE